MRDLSTLAKLLAEEDIHVVHRNQSTAMFDVKNRELSLPIWKDMSKNIQDLMTLHEVGHALWTPLEMMEQVKEENIEFSFVNVLEDVRIEKLVQKKYPGSVRVFNKGYKELIAQNFFNTVGKDIAKYNLIDRINLHFKHHIDVPFSDKEKVWVQKANQTKTPQDVIDLAKELYEYVSENEESQGENQEEQNASGDDGNNQVDTVPSPSAGQDKETSEVMKTLGLEESEESDDESSSSDSSDDSGEESEKDETKDAGSDTEKTDDTEEETKTEKSKSGSEGGKSDGPIASTDYAWNESSKELLNDDGKDYKTAFIPQMDLKKTIVPISKVLEELNDWYLKESKYDDKYFNKTKEELEKTKNDSKKTVAYMVKEFEMKKSADAYARATTSKTGMLDMGQLHTYKYNDDIFAKVTSLPGAKNHGLVMFLDWSGSMSGNLKGTLNQLYNLIWFCKKVNIPFDVYAFTDLYRRYNDKETVIQEFRSGELDVNNLRLLHFFSDKMKNTQEFNMMHNLYMIASQWTYRDWRNDGYPYKCPIHYNLGGTPLNSAIISAMQIVPEFKSSRGIQKVHTVFLTDGSSNVLRKFVMFKRNDVWTKGDEGVSDCWGKVTTTYIDKKNGNKVISEKGSRQDQTEALLELLRQKVSDMSLVNFFIAGSGRKGNVSEDNVRYVMGYNIGWRDAAEMTKKIRKENVGIIPKGLGFDTTYILPGLGNLDMDSELDLEDGVTYNKGQLKRAFAKMSNAKIVNRPLLNNFIKMVA
tara:strand:- start:1367 stop:3631 length:2265 start_codon:yes stop_codon:yes gene_type:complete